MRRFQIIVVAFLFSCNNTTEDTSSKYEYPSKEELKYKIGDCLSFKTSDSTYGCVVVCDFSKDDRGIWYGTFYCSYDSSKMPTITNIRTGKIMGRKVASSIDNAGFKACLDGEFIIDSLFTNKNLFTLIGNVNIKNIDLGSHGAVDNMKYLKISFQRGKQIRLTEPDHYSKHLSKINDFHPEEYFEMRDFEK